MVFKYFGGKLIACAPLKGEVVYDRRCGYRAVMRYYQAGEPTILGYFDDPEAAEQALLAERAWCDMFTSKAAHALPGG